jgi:hypothetical protein
MAGYVHDDSHWPVLRVVLPKKPVDDLEFGDHLHSLDGFLLRREPFAIIFQLTRCALLGFEHPERMRRHVMAHRALAEQYLLGVAFVPPTRLQRRLLAALLWLVHPPCPTALFDDLPSALDWAHDRALVRGSEAGCLASVADPRAIRDTSPAQWTAVPTQQTHQRR